MKLRIFLVTALLFLVACGASPRDTKIEEARFALDRGDWAAAINYSNQVLEQDPDDVQAALILADGYLGRGGFRILELVQVIVDQISRRHYMKAVYGFCAVGSKVEYMEIINAFIALVNDLRTEPVRSSAHFIDYNFRLGLLMLITSFFEPAAVAQPEVDGPINVNDITEEMRASLVQDFIYFDDRFVSMGMSDTDPIVTAGRSTFCVLENASTDTSDGFDLPALRDLVLCELSPNYGADLTPADFQSVKISSCTDFNYDACLSSGDTAN